MQREIKNILVSRTDNIGDVVLTLPLTGFLKERFPGCNVTFLGKGYTKPIIEACQFIDAFMDWDELSALPEKEAVKKIKDRKIDCIVHVFPNWSIAKLAKKAGISIRIGTSRRLYHLFTCNHLVKLSRKKSTLHEAQLNIKLLAPIAENTDVSLDKLPDYYGLKVSEEDKARWNSIINDSKFNLIIHPFSKGSAREWGIENYEKLIRLLPADKFDIYLTGTAAEGDKFRERLLGLGLPNVTDMSGKLSLAELISFIASCDGLLACSTGPLHIAAAFGVHAIGIYPPMRPIHPGRWAPVGKHAKVFVLEKECSDCRKNNLCTCIQKIEPEHIVRYLLTFIK